jgi:hypothetical protein
MEAYTLKKKKTTGEYHLFEGVMTAEGCTSKQLSICQKMDKSESAGNVFACEEENADGTHCMSGYVNNIRIKSYASKALPVAKNHIRFKRLINALFVTVLY